MIRPLEAVAFLLTAAALGACDRPVRASADLLPGVDVAAADVNSFIQLADRPEMANSYKNDDTLSLHLTNLSSKEIFFPDNFDSRILMLDDGQWRNVADNAYNAGAPFVLPTREAYPLGMIVSVLPVIPHLNAPTTIRVVVVGRLGNESGRSVAAYADVIIHP